MKLDFMSVFSMSVHKFRSEPYGKIALLKHYRSDEIRGFMDLDLLSVKQEAYKSVGNLYAKGFWVAKSQVKRHSELSMNNDASLV